MDWATVLGAVNLGLGLLLAAFSFQYWKATPPEPWRWIKFMYFLTGLYWAGIYGYVVLVNVTGLQAYDPVIFGRVFIRPAFTLTLTAMAAGAIARIRKIQ